MQNAIADIFDVQIKPNISIADAADSIKNGFKLVFGDSVKIVMCWSHMRRNVSKNLPKFIRDKKSKWNSCPTLINYSFHDLQTKTVVLGFPTDPIAETQQK